MKLEPGIIGQRLEAFYAEVDELFRGRKLPEESNVPKSAQTVFTYLKAATKATNDKYARVERANVISSLLAADHHESESPTKRRRTTKK